MSLRIPQPARAVLAALRVDGSGDLSLPEASWDRALEFADREQLTLALRSRLAASGGWSSIPERVRERLDRNLADNTERTRRIREAFAEIGERLTRTGVDFVLLKGFSHSPAFVEDPFERVQYDIDLFCLPESVYRARDVLLDLGYEPMEGAERLPTDHLPAMVRKTGWRWRGNYFDPDLPPTVDLHFRFWDFETERVGAPGVGYFWKRRVGRELDLTDRLGYAALHALRHLLRGSLRLYHVYEIARFLERREGDAAFWSRWRELHPEELRRLEGIAFRLAGAYFGAPALGGPPVAEAWFERHAWSPVEALFHPNKHELLLHLSLLGNSGDRWGVLRRRLLPLRLPGPVDAVHVPAEQMTARLWFRKQVRYLAFLGERFVYHARVLLPTLWAIARWR